MVKNYLTKILLIPFLILSSIKTQLDEEAMIDLDFNFNEEDIKERSCLLNEDGTKQLDKDPNKAFILGKCNPVILVPGLFATRLVAEINCLGLMSNKVKEAEVRLFCGETLCKKGIFGDYSKEEYTLWPALFDNPFKLYEDHENPDNLCFAYFMKYFNDVTECPKDKTSGDEICLYSDYVRIRVYGATEKSYKKSSCGLRSIKNIVDPGYRAIPDNLCQSPSSNGFNKMIDFLSKLGYSAGFSLMGLPYDFRRFIETNKAFHDMFEDSIMTLFRNTGKKVIIVAHSLGNLNVWNQLLKKSKITDRIKKFIAVSPPFAGATKTAELYITGSDEFKSVLFNKMTINISKMSQKLFTPVLPVSYQLSLRPINDYVEENKKQYEPFIEAISDLSNSEISCLWNSDKNCKIPTKFKKLFDFFPMIKDEECNDDEEKKIEKNQNLENLKKQNRNTYEYFPSYSKCRHRIYDFTKCPFIKILKKAETIEDLFSEVKKNCGNTKANLFYYNNNCSDKNSNCFWMYIAKYIKNIYEEIKFSIYLINLSAIQGIDVNLIKQETKVQTISKVATMLEYTNKISNFKSFPKPVVKTDIIYSAFMDTRTAYFFKEDKDDYNYQIEDIFYYGGDSTVPTHSSLLVGLKWIYDSVHLDKTKNNINLIEYCSLMSKNKKYKYNSKEDKIYSTIGCECLNEHNNEYILKNINSSVDKCSHSIVVSDNHVLNYLYNEISKEKIYDSVDKYDDSVKWSVGKYDSKKNYREECDQRIFETFA